MNEEERKEIKTEMYLKNFMKYCSQNAKKLGLNEKEKEDYLTNCIVRMSSIANRVQKAGLKP